MARALSDIPVLTAAPLLWPRGADEDSQHSGDSTGIDTHSSIGDPTRTVATPASARGEAGASATGELVRFTPELSVEAKLRGYHVLIGITRKWVALLQSRMQAQLRHTATPECVTRVLACAAPVGVDVLPPD